MLACAADEIVCDQFSIVGSIGVVGGRFRLSQADGEARRRAQGLHFGRSQGDARSVPAGKARGRETPESDPEGYPRAVYRAGQGTPRQRLSGADKTLFSGEFWTAPRAVELGLADGIGDLRSTLRERYGEKVRTPLIMAERSLFGRRLPGVDHRRRLGAASRTCRRIRLGAGDEGAVVALRVVRHCAQSRKCPH